MIISNYYSFIVKNESRTYEYTVIVLKIKKIQALHGCL